MSDRHDQHARQACDDRCERPVHPGDHDDGPRRPDQVLPREHPVDPGNADVDDELRGTAEVGQLNQGLPSHR